MKTEIHAGKAAATSVVYIIALVILPYFIFNYAILPHTPVPISNAILVEILIMGIFTGISGFFKALFEPGTRLHGLMNIIFAIWFTINLYYFFGGGLGGNADFGTISGTLSYYDYSINLSFLAFLFIGLGCITIVIYLYEVLA